MRAGSRIWARKGRGGDAAGRCSPGRPFASFSSLTHPSIPPLHPAIRPHTSAVDAWLLGSKVSLGRAKWEAPAVPGEAAATAAAEAAAPGSTRASIFSVADGRRLAQEPVRHLTAFEAARAARVADAAVDARTLAGLQLLPRFTPGRALLWGSILAAWGTAAAAVGAGRAVGAQRLEDLPAALRARLAPLAESLRARAAPAREALAPAFFAGAGDGTPGEAAAGATALAKKLKGRLSSAA